MTEGSDDRRNVEESSPLWGAASKPAYSPTHIQCQEKIMDHPSQQMITVAGETAKYEIYGVIFSNIISEDCMWAINQRGKFMRWKLHAKSSVTIAIHWMPPSPPRRVGTPA